MLTSAAARSAIPDDLPGLEALTALLPPRLRPDAALGVLDVTKYFGPTTGGVRTYLLEKARYVEADPALRQVLVLPGAESARGQAEGVRWYRLWGPPVPRQDPYRFLLARGTLRRIIAHERPDLIEVGSPFIVPWLARSAARGLGVPIVWFFHSNLMRLSAPNPSTAALHRRAAGRLVSRYVRRVARIASATIATSHFAARDLEGLGVAPVYRVPLGVDLDLFHPCRRSTTTETRRREHLPQGPLAVFIGRLAREKEVDILLDGWREVERRTGARLVVIGDGPSREWYQRRPGAERVLWRPFQRDRDRLADLLAAADLYVAPCSIETFGLSSLEAMASGTPVLSAGQGGVAEQVAASGAGALFQPGSAGSLAEAAVRLLQSDLTALGDRGRAFAERHHAWPAVLARLFEVYREILGR